jgi:ketosteroid isomerase-like protein
MTRRGHIGDCYISKRGQKLRRSAAAIAFAAILVNAPLLGAQAQHPHPRHKEDAKRQVEKLEETWRVAQLNGDVETMDRLLSDDYIGITMNGQIVTKMQQLDRMRTRTLSLTKIELDDVKVKLIGQTAVVTSHADVEGTNDGESVHGNYRYTRVYTRIANGSWKITNFEATRVGEPPQSRRAREPEPLPDAGTPPAPQKLVAGDAVRR